jgi:transposase
MPRTAPSIVLKPTEQEALGRLSSNPTSELRISQRAQIILCAAAGHSNTQIHDQLGLDLKTIGKWRSRYLQRRQDEPGSGIEQWLSDASRPGRPPEFDEFFWTDVLAIATSDPEDSQRPVTHWSSSELAEEVVHRELASRIHRSTISRFLADCKLQPHRVKEWINRKPDPEFDQRAHRVKQLLVDSQKVPSAERAVISFDEKTGMQAKERIAPSQSMTYGEPARIEFEYARHGTLVLFGMMLVATGEIFAHTRPNRTNPVTAAVLRSLLQELLEAGYKKIDVVLDQLNTHWSQDLVREVARLCDLPELPEEAILTGVQRRAWLEEPNKPIVFYFTPKHASWLNPIEIWFGVLARKVLRRGSFCSTSDLEEKVHRFVEYFNKKMARPYKFNTWEIAA